MQLRSLMVAALLILGVGCDDPEVEEKVGNVLVYGLEEAQVTCNVNPFVPNGETGGCMGVNWPLYIVAHRFVDGSTFVKARNTRYGDVLDILYFNRQQPVEFHSQWANSQLDISLGEGELVLDWSTYYGNCPPEPPAPLLTFQLDDETKCTGRNLEAFGAIP